MSAPVNPAAGAPETEALIQRVAGMIAGARALPLSSSVKLDNKEEVLELLREASDRLPEELRQARWMLKEREEFLAATQRRADELVEAARSEAQRLVQRTEILKEAQSQARRTVEEARDEARRLRLEAEDYADQRLAQFEIVLERTLKTVAAGRQKLAGIPDREDERTSQGAGQGTGGGVPGVPSGGTVGIVGGFPAGSPRPSGSVVGRATFGRPPVVPGRSGGVTVGPFSAVAPGGAAGEKGDDGQAGEESIFDQDSVE